MKSVYIHIPFCKSICSYCDFCKMYYNSKFVNDYLEALEKEIKSNYKNEVISTLYIGGGTPNCLSNDELKKLFDIVKIFKLDKDYEFTIECNVEFITTDNLKIFKDNKVNRLSIGIESVNSNNLKYLNRNYDKKLVEEKVLLAKKYFNNINGDLIYALPNSNIKDLEEDISFLLSLDLEHISTYSLIIEDNTILKNNNAKNIDEEVDYEMYKLICDKLKNYHHYEISNFSKYGYESKHNLTYWHNLNYYGFGLGASGYIDNIRYDNTRSLNNYIKGNYVLNKEVVDTNLSKEYYLILGLRLIDGINIGDYNNRYNDDLLKNEVISKLINENKLVLDKGNIKINIDYIYVSNDILVEIIGG